MENVPETYFFEDDGNIPNSKYPLIIYKAAFSETGNPGAQWLEQKFESNNWTNSWRNGVFPYHHYHSITHEVLGVYSGNALLQLGGANGKKIQVAAGDIIIIPAGVGHKNIESSKDFAIVGAYPNGMEYDLMKGKANERPLADENISKVPFPDKDPLLGKNNGLIKFWNNQD
ncbi:cupin domain-containing protein [Dyadobacter sp. CY345]|uniref:cupin domain-containing protein n=1 Tax=Dyadobacter sp. CY345 TaxID=2909335 RepID=UPI001F3B3578|nr:cupin domain-containing protein [Dyadobacter sp. CY345]MCF2444236.1 cupin domain-containing protein [Dyadobacter sp. CY345]